MCKTWTPFPLIAESNMSLPDIAAVPTAMGLLEGNVIYIFYQIRILFYLCKQEILHIHFEVVITKFIKLLIMELFF